MPQSLPMTVPADPALWSDFLALCDHGGRLTGTCGEVAARDWAAGRLAAIPGGRLSREPTRYDGWHCSACRLLIGDEALEATALLCSAGTEPADLTLEVVDCGRGTPADIAAAGSRVAGRAVLVQHEYMFAEDTVHRRVKLAAAVEAGAAAFLIAAPEPGMGAMSGSGGLPAGMRRIPALGISAEAAARIRAMPGTPVRLHVVTELHPDAETETLVLDLPGGGPDRVVLSAHIDGHAPAESALDNATGVALALALARQAAPYLAQQPRGLTVCLFSAEEWALTGSKTWLAGLGAAARERLVFNLNLDTVTGGSRLTALTSGFPRLGGFVTAAAGASLGVHLPLMANSDHANFAMGGIPALRLVSGFNERDSKIRLLLSRHDRRDMAAPQDFAEPARVAWAILRAALTAPAAQLAALRATA
ncbi:MAG: M28 family peptidase [Acetobacteraceae bacterium]|nr:M28 family peptidase [Acetobacteraceae bacterium]